MSGARRVGVQTAERDMQTACRRSCRCAMRSSVQMIAGAAVARPRASALERLRPPFAGTRLRVQRAGRSAWARASRVDVREHVCLRLAGQECEELESIDG